ncbi:MAG: SIS domain-containing protein [Bdellovibrionaceae bacterium]|nr:SIS domain-containing protein [Pseudobdellovibrionaceae bacterium]
MNAFIDEAFGAALMNLKKMTESAEVKSQVAHAAQMIIDSCAKGGQLLAAGNGGSAADAQHMIAELVVKLGPDRSPIRGIALSTDTSIMTAIGNDYGYDYVFSRQIYAHMKPNDLFLGITTSGNSPNILRALEAVKNVGGKSVLLTGKEGGKCKALADTIILVPGETTNMIQECHQLVYHTLCFLVEKGLADKGVIQYNDKKI